MCRNITELRGLEPPASPEEITAAAEQYVRKVTGLRPDRGAGADAMRDAAREIAEVTTRLLQQVPARRQPPASVPPLRRPQVRSRMGLPPLPG